MNAGANLIFFFRLQTHRDIDTVSACCYCLPLLMMVELPRHSVELSLVFVFIIVVLRPHSGPHLATPLALPVCARQSAVEDGVDVIMQKLGSKLAFRPTTIRLFTHFNGRSSKTISAATLPRAEEIGCRIPKYDIPHQIYSTNYQDKVYFALEVKYFK